MKRSEVDVKKADYLDSYTNPYPPCNGDDEIDLYELWLILKKRFKWIIGSLLAFVIGALIYLAIAPPIYRTEAVIYPTNIDIKIPAISQSLTEVLIVSTNFPDPADVLKSSYIREQVIKKLKLMPLLFPSEWDKEKNTWKDPDNAPTILDALKKLNELITISKPRRGSTITLSVEFPNKPEVAYSIAQAMLEEARKFLKQQNAKLLQKYKTYLERKIAEIKQKIKTLKEQQVARTNSQSVEIDLLLSDLKQFKDLYQTIKLYEIKLDEPFQIISPPYVPDKKEPYKPKKGLILAISALTGLMLGIFLAFFVEWLESVRNRNKEIS